MFYNSTMNTQSSDYKILFDCSTDLYRISMSKFTNIMRTFTRITATRMLAVGLRITWTNQINDLTVTPFSCSVNSHFLPSDRMWSITHPYTQITATPRICKHGIDQGIMFAG